MKTLYTTETVSQDGREGRVESIGGGFAHVLSKPSAANKDAVTPEHLFGAAYAACFHGAVKAAAERAHMPLKGSQVVAAVSLKEDAKGGYHLSVELRAALPGLSSQDAQRILHQAHETCPYSKLMRGQGEVTVITD